LTTRERLAKMGLSALLSYGWVSNMSYAVTLSLSWYGFSKQVSESILVHVYLLRYPRDSSLSNMMSIVSDRNEPPVTRTMETLPRCLCWILCL
jgi:hypothetical protein